MLVGKGIGIYIYISWQGCSCILTFCLVMWNYESGVGDGQVSSFLSVLKSGFSNVVIFSQTSESVCFSVENYVNGCLLQLLVRMVLRYESREGVTPNWVAPPCFIVPYTNVEIPVHEASTRCEHGATDPLYVRWDSSRPDLVDATHQAFLVCLLYWGKVAPPCVGGVVQDLFRYQINTARGSFEPLKEVDRLLQFPNELELFACQHPVVSEMRLAGEETLIEMKNTIEENEKLRGMIKSQQDNIVSLQLQLRNRLAELRGLEEDELFVALCTPEAILQTLKKDALRLEDTSRDLARSVMDTPTTNKRLFESALDRFKSNSVQMHLAKLKFIEYEKQLAGSTRVD